MPAELVARAVVGALCRNVVIILRIRAHGRGHADEIDIEIS